MSGYYPIPTTSPHPSHSARVPPTPLGPTVAHAPFLQPLPTTKSLRGSLIIIFLSYGVLGGVGIWFATNGGKSWNGDTETLTTVLAVLGVVFTYGARELQSTCQKARMQYLTGKAVTEAVSLQAIHEMDMAIRGPTPQVLTTGFWVVFYRIVFPVFAVLMSAVFKKSLTTGLQPEKVTVSGNHSALLDPVNVGSSIRGTSWPGAILYNTTSSLGSSFDPGQTSWTYIVANGSDGSGLETIQYFMPCLPTLVASGSAGYINYSATVVPALSTTLLCDVAPNTATREEGGIENSNNNIYLFSQNDGAALIKVVTSKTAWKCVAVIGRTTGSAHFVSDHNGNWNCSSVEMGTVRPISFSTSAARLDMMADIISDALGTTAGYSGWDWDTSTPSDPGFSDMLVATRLSFATAVLGFGFTRMNDAPHNSTGTAFKAVRKVILLENYALILTIVLLWLQATFALAHACLPSEFRIDLGILQLMEMREAAGANGPILRGHCSKFRRDIREEKVNIAIRARADPPHLGILDYKGGNVAGDWHVITRAGHYL